MALLLFLLLSSNICPSLSQYYGSNFLSALRGYGSDLCRFVSCPLGQYCINGVCQVNSALSGLGYGGFGSGYNGLGAYGTGLGAYGMYAAANKLCADTVDCYSGQVCMAGRCIFQSGGGMIPGNSALGALGAYGIGGPYGMFGTDPMALLATSSIYSPYGGNAGGYGYGGLGYSGLGSLAYRQSGLQLCTLMQDCPNGQICVNGYCSESNVAYGGSQLFKPPSSCATGAICPIGWYCMGGMCMKDYMAQTSTCGLSFLCPFGSSCHFGRCIPSNSLMLYGKKRRKRDLTASSHLSD